MEFDLGNMGYPFRLSKGEKGVSTKKTTTENVYHSLREMILGFELFPGSRVTETELAAHFGVSRTPIREAMQRLEVEGYLTVRPKQGGYIRQLDIEELADYYQARIPLELLSLELACTSMPDAKVRALVEAWDPSVQKGRSDDPAEMDAVEESFHMAIAEGGGNRAILGYLEDINHRIRPIRRLDFTQRERIDRTYEEHHQIAQHLLKRDLQAAQAAMRAHILRSEQFAKGLTLIQLAKVGARRKFKPG